MFHHVSSCLLMVQELHIPFGWKKTHTLMHQNSNQPAALVRIWNSVWPPFYPTIAMNMHEHPLIYLIVSSHYIPSFRDVDHSIPALAWGQAQSAARGQPLGSGARCKAAGGFRARSSSEGGRVREMAGKWLGEWWERCGIREISKHEFWQAFLRCSLCQLTPSWSMERVHKPRCGWNHPFLALMGYQF